MIGLGGGRLRVTWLATSLGLNKEETFEGVFGFRFSRWHRHSCLSALFTTANATSPVHPSDAPSARLSAATRSNSLSARNTISPAGLHRQSASTAGCASILLPAGSSFPDPAAEKYCRRSGKSKPEERTNSMPPRNRSGTGPAAPASPSLGWKTTSSRFDRSPCGCSAAQNRSSSSPARP